MKIHKLLKLAVLSACLLTVTGCGKKEKDVPALTETTDISDENAINNTENTGATGDNTEITSEEPAIPPYMAPATDVDGIELTDEILEKGILNPGNPDRLKIAMERAAKGEPLTIAYIGGSITQGSNASSQNKCYAYLSHLWFKETFPNSEITYINVGIGGTDSWLGIHRVDEDVIQYKPDIVIVEYSVNDGNTLNKETYDSLLRHLLESDSEPAVLALLLAHENGSFAKEHAPIAFKYHVPIISYSALLSNKLVSWSSVGDTDGVHPKDSGHQLISYLLTSYFRNVMSGVYDDVTSPYKVPDLKESSTKCRYDSSKILYSDEFFRYETEYFTAGGVWSMLSNKNGWSTTSAGSFAFQIKASEIGIIYMQTNKAPEKNDIVYEVYLDNEPVGRIKGYDANTWGQHLEYFQVYLDDTPSVHYILLKPSEDSTGTDFTIMGIGATGYSEP